LLVALGAFYHLAAALAIAAAVALCAALLRYGSFGARFVRVLRPWALVQVPISVAGLIAAWTVNPVSALNAGFPVDLFSKAGSGLLLIYNLAIAFAALRVGAYRFALRDIVSYVVSMAWVAVTILYVVVDNWLRHTVHLTS
jgi:hypothetical protein